MIASGVGRAASLSLIAASALLIESSVLEPG
jgi:hypothetical protein